MAEGLLRLGAEACVVCVVGLKLTLIAWGLIPGGVKARVVRDSSFAAIGELAKEVADRFGEEGAKAVADVMARIGRMQGEAMKRELGLSESLEGAVDAWRAFSGIYGVKAVVRRVGERAYEFEHRKCPGWEVFRERGLLPAGCKLACLPLVEGIAKGVYPEARVEVVREPSVEEPCVKRLVG
ncbi:MAG: hypothetical protein DRN99_09395 [Thermoproteota archaeon]|nr:MAG: hypothetical protein DRN99_09395 [Candidatus Korarchaeota archaeon]